jgi:polysaccharide pyruvyl transferase WcaK-like protein
MGASLGTGNRGVSALGASLVKLLSDGQRSDTTVGMLLGRRTARAFALRTGNRVLSIETLNFRLALHTAFGRNLLLWFALACLYRAFPLAGWRAFLRRRHPLIRATAEAQLIGDIRGGDSFSDIYGVRGFLLGSLAVLAVVLVRGHIVLFPQTYGPYKSPIARAVACFILRRASIILSRDRESMTTVTQLIGATTRCQFCPDVAFSLEARPPEKLSIEPPLPPSVVSGPWSVVPSAPCTVLGPPSSVASPVVRRPSSVVPCLVGLNVNGLMFNGGYTRNNMFGLKLNYPRFLVRLLEALLENPNQHLLLVPHTFAPPTSVESDPGACRTARDQLAPELRARVHLVEGEYDQSEIKWIIGQCDFFIGSRMHACIAALSQGIPAVGVAYSKKFRGVFETVGAEDSVIDGRDVDAEQAVNRVLELYAQRETLRQTLSSRVPLAQQRLYEVFQQLLPTAQSAPRSETESRDTDLAVPSQPASRPLP